MTARQPRPPTLLLMAAQGDDPTASPTRQLQWALNASRRDQLTLARERNHTVSYLSEDVGLALAQLGRPGADPEELERCRDLLRRHQVQLLEEAKALAADLEELLR